MHFLPKSSKINFLTSNPYQIHMQTTTLAKYISKIQPKNRDDFEIIKTVKHSIDIADAMGEPLWLGDRNHNGIYVNPTYEKLTGYSLEECIGKPSDFCFDEESKKTIAKHHKLRSNGESSQYEATIISKSGKKIPILVNGAPTSTGGTIGIFINLTEKKKLVAQGKIAQQILRYSSEAIVILNKNRQIKLWSNGAETTFGYKEEDVINKSIQFLIPPELEKYNKNLLKEVEKKNYVKNVETKRRTKNGENIDVSISITKVTDEKGKFIGYLIIYRDITNQKKVNTELQKRFEAIQDAYKELGLQRRQLDYINEIINCAISANPSETLEKLIVSAICLLTKADGGVLRECDKNSLILKACFGVSQKWWTKNKVPFENSFGEEAILNRRPIIIDNIDRHPKYVGIKLLKSHKFKTMISIPLIFNNSPLGTLNIYAIDPAKFRLIETDFLENIGKLCSLALYSKRQTLE